MKNFTGFMFLIIVAIVNFATQSKSDADTNLSASPHSSILVLTASQSGGESISPASAATESAQPTRPTTKTIIADLLMIDGDFYVVRGERGEIRIEVTPDTKLAESFKFGDRIKAVVLPDDSAVSIERAKPGEEVGVIAQPTPAVPVPQPTSPPGPSQQKPTPSGPGQPPAEAPQVVTPRPTIRIIVADLLMVDRDFYVVRGERGEIRIEVTPDTKLSEEFTFGDRIKARVRSDDSAISIERAKPEDLVGIQTEEPSTSPATQPIQSTAKTKKQDTQGATSADKGKQDSGVAKPAKYRTIVAEILMIDGDFYVVRGERGEIRIEVKPETKLTEEFKFGDKIKAKVLPNDTALSIERANPDDPIGITE